MLILFLILGLSLQLVQCQMASTDKYMRSIYCVDSCSLNIDGGDIGQMKLIQIFSPLVPMNIYSSNQRLQSVLQAGFILQKNRLNSIQIEKKYYSINIIWYRVITLSQNAWSWFLLNDDFNFNITRNKDFSLTVSKNYFFVKSISNYQYEIWVVPIFPKGQFQSWANQYPVSSSAIINVLNSSVDYNYLQSTGILIGNLFWDSVKLSDRRAYTYLIIHRVVDKDQNELQLNPAIIYGCLSQDVFSSFNPTPSFRSLNVNSSCQTLYMDYTWFIISCSILSFWILFSLIGFTSEGIQIFIHTWLIGSYVSSIGYHYIIQNIYTYYYGFHITIFGIGIPVAIFWTILSVKVTKQGYRFRMLCNSICIVLIVLSILYFALENFLNKLYILIGGIVVTLVLFVPLMFFNGFTSTFGRLFIDIFFICFGFSLTLLQHSVVLFLFQDFFNYILFGGQIVQYFSFFLWNDVIMLSIWIFLMFLFGLSSYRSWRKNNITIKPDNNQPSSGINTNYGAIHRDQNDHVTTSFVTNPIVALPPFVISNIPTNQAQPSAPYALHDPPPPYSSVCER